MGREVQILQEAAMGLLLLLPIIIAKVVADGHGDDDHEGTDWPDVTHDMDGPWGSEGPWGPGGPWDDDGMEGPDGWDDVWDPHGMDPQCCHHKRVEGSIDPELDGDYYLVADHMPQPYLNEDCMNACLYVKKHDEDDWGPTAPYSPRPKNHDKKMYCFAPSKDANVMCGMMGPMGGGGKPGKPGGPGRPRPTRYPGYPTGDWWETGRPGRPGKPTGDWWGTGKPGKPTGDWWGTGKPGKPTGEMWGTGKPGKPGKPTGEMGGTGKPGKPGKPTGAGKPGKV